MTPIGGDLKKLARFSRLSEHESFINKYESNTIVGIIIYVLFIMFLTAEVLTVAFLAPKAVDGSTFRV